MKGKRFLIGFAAMAITASGGSLADEIGSANAERIALTYRRTNSAALQQRIQTHNDSETAREEARATAAEEAKSAEAAAAEVAAKEKKCESYRARMQTLTQSRRVYRQGDDGERQYLDEQEQQKARQRVEDLIAENCSS